MCGGGFGAQPPGGTDRRTEWMSSAMLARACSGRSGENSQTSRRRPIGISVVT